MRSLRVQLWSALISALAWSCEAHHEPSSTAEAQAGAPSAAQAGSAHTSAGGGGVPAPAGAGGSPTVAGGFAGSPAASGGSNAGGAEAGGAAASAGSSSAGAANGGDLGVAGAGAAGSGAGGASPFPPSVTRPRIMIVGDSISAGPGCYKKFLLRALTEHHYSSFEFVGQYADDCGGGVRHSAVSCSTAEQYTQSSFTMPNCSQGMSFSGMSTLVQTHQPDLILLQLGVNDVWNGKSVETTLANYALLIQQARAHHPRVVVVVAQIQKIRPDCSSDPTVTERAEALVQAVPAWASGQTTEDSPVFVADLWTNSDWSKAETLDCVHPNDVGAEKMGMNWFNALKGILTPD